MRILEIHITDYLEPVGEVEYAYVPVISGGRANISSAVFVLLLTNTLCVSAMFPTRS